MQTVATTSVRRADRQTAMVRRSSLLKLSLSAPPMQRGKASTNSASASSLVPCHEEMSGVLRIDAAGVVDRRRRVRGAESELLEEALLQRAALVDRVEIAVFAVRVDHAVRVDDEGIHAPLESFRVIAHARHVAVRVARAAQRVRVLEAPLDAEVRIELRDEVRLRIIGAGAEEMSACGRVDRSVG